MCYVYYVFNVFVVIKNRIAQHTAQGQPKRMGRPTSLMREQLYTLGT